MQNDDQDEKQQCRASISNVNVNQMCQISRQSQQEIIISVEEILREQQIVPIRPLGFGSFGIVYLVYDLDYGIVAAKISVKDEKIQRVWEACVNIQKEIQSCPFILKYLKQLETDKYAILMMEYANLKTLDIIVKCPQIPLPMSTLRAIMKQILEGMQVYHLAGFIHCPPNTGIVHVEIAGLDFAKRDVNNEPNYTAGVIPYMA
ncbi:MAG: hypothetical protein EZS28_019346 [Streblomastix strix]|uniref:Protein kinase domain-containing protein n=1 Tax=Streblomastix strix TaxID=222440 RepID=A0A5J4VSE6_9EUKA|nr:MAG: hypothetical protein EZS28_019346 [Streblomastix strix]